MHIYFSGIGGAGISPLALIAHQAGFAVSGSDKQDSSYVQNLRKQGIDNIHIGQDKASVASLHGKQPIDWMVFSSAVLIENPDHPEIVFAQENNIKISKRDEFLTQIIKDNDLKLIAIAGTHGKTTTTAMMIWLMKHLEPVSYAVGAKIPYGDMGHFDKKSQYFIYECDEFDRNFLAFSPHLAMITGIDYDHHEIYPTRQSYQEAFKQFLDQSKSKLVWQSDKDGSQLAVDDTYEVIDDNDPLVSKLKLPGEVNRRDALQTIRAAKHLTGKPLEELTMIMEKFPGVSRRFERITDNLFTDYAHTIPKIKGILQLAGEVSESVVIVYEPLTNRRQHFIREEYKTLFKGVKKLYWVPSYLAREDPEQEIIEPEEFIERVEEPKDKQEGKLDNDLKQAIQGHLSAGDLVICLSGGGGGSLDEWIRKEFK
jgi:UDP-N-acetylmuramate--alanine ligase